MLHFVLAGLILTAPAHQEPPVDSMITLVNSMGSKPLEDVIVDPDHLWVPAASIEAINGFVLKPEGLCWDDICIPLPADSSLRMQKDETIYIDAAALAERIGQPVAHSRDRTVWSFGESTMAGRPLASGIAPDFALPDREGNLVRLSDFRGKKVFLLAWASW